MLKMKWDLTIFDGILIERIIMFSIAQPLFLPFPFRIEHRCRAGRWVAMALDWPRKYPTELGTLSSKQTQTCGHAFNLRLHSSCRVKKTATLSTCVVEVPSTVHPTQPLCFRMRCAVHLHLPGGELHGNLEAANCLQVATSAQLFSLCTPKAKQICMSPCFGRTHWILFQRSLDGGPAGVLGFRPFSHRTRTCSANKWDLLLSMGVFTLLASNIKGKMFQFACVSHRASCVN